MTNYLEAAGRKQHCVNSLHLRWDFNFRMTDIKILKIVVGYILYAANWSELKRHIHRYFFSLYVGLFHLTDGKAVLFFYTIIGQSLSRSIRSLVSDLTLYFTFFMALLNTFSSVRLLLIHVGLPVRKFIL